MPVVDRGHHIAARCEVARERLVVAGTPALPCAAIDLREQRRVAQAVASVDVGGERRRTCGSHPTARRTDDEPAARVAARLRKFNRAPNPAAVIAASKRLTVEGSNAYVGAGVTTHMARKARTTASASSPQTAALRSPVQPRESGVQPNMEESVI